MYSLVNIPVVARDLARHPHGAMIARDLLHVLALDDAALAALDDAPASRPDLPDETPRRAVREPRALEVLAATRAAADDSGLAAWSAALPLLETAPLGGRTELATWLRDELLAGCWEGTGDLGVLRRPRALAAVVAGVLAAYDGHPADPVAARWRGWVAQTSPALVEDPAVAEVVGAVAVADARTLGAAGGQLRRARAGGWSWAAAMHDACWAVELTGRTRAAAVAQLAAVSALPVVATPDAVAAVAAAVHGAVVADVLDAATVAALCGPLLSSLR